MRRTGIHPIDIEELKRNPKPWDPYRMASVLSELWSDQLGYPVEFVLTPKEQEKETG